MIIICFRIFCICLFCSVSGLSYNELFAQSKPSSVVVPEEKRSGDNDEFQPATDESLLFPARQVENNVAVEFFFKPLPVDADGFEKELSKVSSLFSGKNTQNLNSDDGFDFKSRLQKQGYTINDMSAVHPNQEIALFFKITDATMNWPIQGQGFVPDSPIRLVENRGRLENSISHIFKRAKAYGGHFPVDEYTYLFVLNSIDNSISVIDTSSLYSGTPIEIIQLSNNGKCKAVDIDMGWLGRFVYVTMDCDEVAVIDCLRLKITRMIKVGKNPHHVIVQPDGKFAWVCNDGDGTVTVIDTETHVVMNTITVGKGHHEVAFTKDSHFGCVTNSDDNSVTIIDVYTLDVTGTVDVGKQPHGLGFSEMSGFMYVANEGDGTVSVVDILSKSVVKTIVTGKEVRTVKFGPDPRYGYALNKGDDTCSRIDVTRDIVKETIKTGVRPENATFSPDWIFIRNTGEASVTAQSLTNRLMRRNITIGKIKPEDIDLPLGHLSLAPQGDGHSVLVPGPGDRAVYRYAPGEAMAGGTVPSEIYNTQANGPSKLVVYYRGLKEVANGVYMRIVRFSSPGRYEIGFYIDNPELTACFEVNVTH